MESHVSGDKTGGLWGRDGVGDGSLSFPFSFIFRALWLALALPFDRSFPLRVFFCHDSPFVLHIFNKLMKNKNVWKPTSKNGQKRPF